MKVGSVLLSKRKADNFPDCFPMQGYKHLHYTNSLISVMSESMSTGRTQPDSMQENQMLVALGKEDGKGGGEYDIKGRKTWKAGMRGGGMRGSQ